MKIILLGAPGSGKGTQATNVAKTFDIPHISTGDLFRDNIKNQTPLGLKVKAIIDAGNLCPDDLTFELVKDRLNKPDCANGYLLDGFPRNLYQAKALDEFNAPDKVVEINVDFAKIEKRITGRRSCPACGGTFHIDFIGNVTKCPTCGGELITRKDDTAETVKNRLSVYSSQTAPLIDYYGEQNKLIVIDGNGEIEKVSEAIKLALSK